MHDEITKQMMADVADEERRFSSTVGSVLDLALWLSAVVTAMCRSVGERSVVYLSLSLGRSRFPHPFPSAAAVFDGQHSKGAELGRPGLLSFLPDRCATETPPTLTRRSAVSTHSLRFALLFLLHHLSFPHYE